MKEAIKAFLESAFWSIEYIDLDTTNIKIPWDETCFYLVYLAGDDPTITDAVAAYTRRFGVLPNRIYHRTLPNHCPGQKPFHAFYMPTTPG